MVELLVALAISSFLILGITQIYVDNKRNYLFQQGQAGNQENSRFTLLLLEQQLAKTGYRRMPDNFFENAFKADTPADCEAFSAGQTIALAKPKKTDEYGICIRYQPARKGEHDCLGNEITGVPDEAFQPANPVVARLTFVPGINGEPGTLFCNGAELVTGLADLRFEFGVGPSNAERRVERFVTADALVGEPIRALRYSALAASDAKHLRGSDDSLARLEWTTVYPDSKAGLEANDSGRLYQLAQGNQTLRNLMP